MSGESGARNRHGDMRSSAASVTGRSSALSNTPASLVARVAGSKPLSTGFSTSGVWPLALNWRARRAVTTVFPPSVPLAVINSPATGTAYARFREVQNATQQFEIGKEAGGER